MAEVKIKPPNVPLPEPPGPPQPQAVPGVELPQPPGPPQPQVEQPHPDLPQPQAGKEDSASGGAMERAAAALGEAAQALKDAAEQFARRFQEIEPQRVSMQAGPDLPSLPQPSPAQSQQQSDVQWPPLQSADNASVTDLLRAILAQLVEMNG